MLYKRDVSESVFFKKMVSIKNKEREQLVHNYSAWHGRLNLGGRLRERCHSDLWKIPQQKILFLHQVLWKSKQIAFYLSSQHQLKKVRMWFLYAIPNKIESCQALEQILVTLLGDCKKHWMPNVTPSFLICFLAITFVV